MVDVFIRNVEDGVFRTFKARAAQEGVTLADELKHSVKMEHGTKLGAAGWLALPTIKLGKRGKNLSKRIDEIVREAAWDDYNRYKRSRR